jgi:hypothetical protein
MVAVAAAEPLQTAFVPLQFSVSELLVLDAKHSALKAQLTTVPSREPASAVQTAPAPQSSARESVLL